MRFIDLEDICNHFKGAVIPHTPEDFVVVEPFRHNLSNDDLNAGITAFRNFLYVLYDRLAADKGRFDIKTSKKEGSVYQRYPVMNDIAVILFTLGIHGRLETEPRMMLTVDGQDLLKTLPMQKYQTVQKMKGKRKLELFNYLSDMGFYFEGVDFSKNIDLENAGTFNITYENDDYLVVGLKLLAEAQANTKTKFYRYTAAIMRCDFQPLAYTQPKAPTVDIIQYVNTQPPEIREWLIDLDKLLTAGGCKVTGEVRNFECDGRFIYTSRKGKKIICKIDMEVGCSYVNPNINHLENSVNIMAELPDSMSDNMKSGKTCGICAENDPNFVHCNHGGPFKFTINDEYYERCRFYGFRFALNDAKEREVLRRWIELELAG